jgi:hypothetical protein
MVVIATAAVTACYASAAIAACCASAIVAVCCGSVAIAACCDSAATAVLHGASLAAATAPSVPRDALDERLLVGTAASDLNTLAGARGARSASPYEHV